MEETSKNNESAQCSSNADNGFLTREECSEYIRKEKQWWGSNLVGWVKEIDGKFFPRFNVWD